MNGLAIEATGLEKAYGSEKVLMGIDIRIPAGTVFSLLGPNGAGKTTTVRILATLSDADAGTARVAGFDVRRDRHRVRRLLSVTGQDVSLDGAQTAEENLRMVGQLTGLSRGAARRRAAELLERFGLTDSGRRRLVPIRVGCDAASTSRRAWSVNTRSSSWTSPPPASTPEAAWRCGR
jgi:ABC-2 type transport system ATP-binding protein